MTVATKEVKNRRSLRYESLDDLMADVRQLVASGDVTTLGNWSFGQILGHLAVSFEASIDGLDLRVPWLMKTMARLFMKKKFLEKSLPPGFTIPEKDKARFVPPATTSREEGLSLVEAAVERLKNEPQRVDHPVLGKLTKEEWTKFHLRHAEMHMSFVQPA